MESKGQNTKKKAAKKQPKAPKYTFKQFLAEYPDDDACLQQIFIRTHGENTPCPDCETETTWHKINGRQCYKSACCGAEIYPLANTPLRNTKTPLTNWFFVIFLFTTSRNGVSAKEVERQLNVSYPTALRMLRKVRELVNEEGEIVLTGTVEIDETLQGGKCPGGGRGWASRNKKCVFGIYERGEGGRVVSQVVPNRKGETLLPIITENTTEDVIAYTDEFRGYNKLGREVAQHATINHSKKEWVRGDVHTQGIEGYWGRMKRSITGTYVSVSEEYLPLYLGEFNFRHNHRTECMFSAVLERFGSAS